MLTFPACIPRSDTFEWDYQVKRSLSRRRVLAISPDLDQLRRIVVNLERAGAEVDAVTSLDAIENELIPHRCIFYAIDNLLEDVEQILPRLRQRAHVALILKQARLRDFTDLLHDPRVNHVIVGDELDRGVFVTARKLLTGDIFGIEKYLPEDTPVHYIRLRDFQGRSQAIDRILDFAKQHKMRRQLRSAIAPVCEELLMNALYDAPVDEQGKQLFAEIAPRERTVTRSPKPVSIRYAVTDQIFAVAVRDRFGRLAKNTILAYINKCLHGNQQIDRKTYGAGLGLYLVANAAASYVVNVAYDIATEVVCTFDRTTRVPLRLVGVFVHPSQAEMLRNTPVPGSVSQHARADKNG